MCPYLPRGPQGVCDRHFTAATTMYLEMGMTYWLGQMEAELAQLA